MSSTRFFEQRVYVAHPGKLAALRQRFENHTFALFAAHGIELVSFMTPVDEPAASDTVIYLLAGPDQETYRARWRAFASDPTWLAAKQASEVDGPLVARIDSTFLTPIPESPLR